MSTGKMPFRVTSLKRAISAAQSVGLDGARVKIGFGVAWACAPGCSVDWFKIPTMDAILSPPLAS